MNRTLHIGAMALALAVSMSLFVTAFAQAGVNATDAEAGEATLRAPVVTVAPARRVEVIARVSVSGTLVAAEEVLVNTRINGFAIERIGVEVGDTVAAGDVLAVLDDSGPAAQLAQAEAELARSTAAIGQAQGQIDAAAASRTEADASLERTDSLRKSGNVSQATLDQAKAASTSARANLASARNGLDVAKAQQTSAISQRDLAALTLERTKIKAPVAGIVSARSARLGEIASGGGEPLFRLIRNAQLEVAVEIVETELGGIDIGDAASVKVAGVGTVAGKVRLIAPTVDARSRLGMVRIAMPKNDGLRAGLSASGWITTDRHEAITVPASAVLTRNLESSVQIVEDGIVARRVVVAGILSENGLREILDGLQGGEHVITRAGAFFVDGDVVRPAESARDAGGEGIDNSAADASMDTDAENAR